MNLFSPTRNKRCCASIFHKNLLCILFSLSIQMGIIFFPFEYQHWPLFFCTILIPFFSLKCFLNYINKLWYSTQQRAHFFIIHFYVHCPVFFDAIKKNLLFCSCQFNLTFLSMNRGTRLFVDSFSYVLQTDNAIQGARFEVVL